MATEAMSSPLLLNTREVKTTEVTLLVKAEWADETRMATSRSTIECRPEAVQDMVEHLSQI